MLYVEVELKNPNILLATGIMGHFQRYDQVAAYKGIGWLGISIRNTVLLPR